MKNKLMLLSLILTITASSSAFAVNGQPEQKSGRHPIGQTQRLVEAGNSSSSRSPKALPGSEKLMKELARGKQAREDAEKEAQNQIKAILAQAPSKSASKPAAAAPSSASSEAPAAPVASSSSEGSAGAQ